MKSFLFLSAFLCFFTCKNSESKVETKIPETTSEKVKPDSTDLSAISTKDIRDFKVLDSKYIDNTQLWESFNKDLQGFTESNYNALKSIVLDKDIPSLQKAIQDGKLSYEALTKFYLFRIRKFDRENDLSLNSVIALNPNVIKEAKQKDIEFKNKKIKHAIFGMPILLKDNIDASGMPTTAGSVALKDNITNDAFIVSQLKAKGALILGKVNLSEWAYFFCGDCPSGYSAIGGQTLNPYGRKVMDSGGSSSGSGVAVAANFCVAAIGSETAGSILSPASQNSTVGLKPTVGLLSRSGIVPISSTLDTPGPIAKNVVDTAILMDAMFGEDKTDPKSIFAIWESGFYTENIKVENLKGKRFGAFKNLMQDPLYANAISILKKLGATIVEFEEEKIELPDFIRLLNLEMKNDVASYLSEYASPNITLTSVADVMTFNRKDSLNVMPYGQKLFQGVENDSATKKELADIQRILKVNGKSYFDIPMKAHNLDGIVSVNNYHADYAAVAEYPALTVPMGYKENGEPEGLTFIAVRLQEKLLLQWAYAYEEASKMRIAPSDYN